MARAYFHGHPSGKRRGSDGWDVPAGTYAKLTGGRTNQYSVNVTRDGTPIPVCEPSGMARPLADPKMPGVLEAVDEVPALATGQSYWRLRVLTSSRGFEAWGNVFGDEVMARRRSSTAC